MTYPFGSPFPEPLATITDEASKTIAGDSLCIEKESSPDFQVGGKIVIQLTGGAKFDNASYTLEQAVGGAGAGDITYAALATADPKGSSSLTFVLQESTVVGAPFPIAPLSDVTTLLLSGNSFAGQATNIALPQTPGVDISIVYNVYDAGGDLSGSVSQVLFGNTLPPMSPVSPSKMAALVFGRSMGAVASKTTFSRIGHRIGSGAGRDHNAALANVADTDWTRISSDDVTSMVARNAAQLANDKIEGLDLEALGLADEAIEAVGLDKAALDFYASAAWGSLERQGTAGYDGYGYVTTAGADYLLTSDLLLGGSVSYEWGRLEYDALVNGKVVRDGWRGDVYGGWQLDALLSVEGFASYGRFKNEVTADFDKGRADSERWMTGAKIESKFDAIGVDISPYASATYMYERIDGYATSGGTVVAASSAELSQGAFGFMIDSRDPVALGLSPFISLQGEWDWINGGDVTMSNGAVLSADDWGVTWSAGLRGRLTGFAPGTWVGDVLEGSDVSLEYTDSTFGRNNTSRSLAGMLSVPLY